MKIELESKLGKFKADLSRPLDISIPLSPEGPRAWYVDPMKIEPVKTERFTGSIAQGGSVNFRNIKFNPHGHGTHTESSGHIEKVPTSINAALSSYFFLTELISIKPEIFEGEERAYRIKGDRIITRTQIEEKLKYQAEALIVRTLPNEIGKLSRVYSGTNPPYFQPKSIEFIRESGIEHLLIDLPSVDREEDGGLLEGHHVFWKGDREGDHRATITEMIYVPDSIKDGLYLMNLQTAPFENDAAPSRPVLFELDKIN